MDVNSLLHNAIGVAVIALLIGYPIAIYNGLVKLRNRFKNAYAQIDVQLKRRYDLIPNLVETCKAYLKHERETLEAVMAARNQAASAIKRVAGDPSVGGGMEALMGAEAVLSGAMGRLMAVMEAYPDLKADSQTSQVMEELTATENRIAFARQAYNDAAMVYNTKRESFPDNVLGGLFGFKLAPMWELDEKAPERERINVSFS